MLSYKNNIEDYVKTLAYLLFYIDKDTYMKNLVRATNKSPVCLNYSLKRLEKDGLIEIKRDERKRLIITLTENGKIARRALRKLKKIVEKPHEKRERNELAG